MKNLSQLNIKSLAEISTFIFHFCHLFKISE